MDSSAWSLEESQILQWFDCSHLSKELAVIVVEFVELTSLLRRVSSGPERTVALRKLLEAKDAAVRGAINKNRSKLRQLHIGSLYYRDQSGERHKLANFIIEAQTAAEAAAKVLSENWDDRLDAAGCLPEVVFESKTLDAADKQEE